MDFDLLVIGAGSGGLASAKRAARHGARVGIIEGDRVGGTCVIRGCVPKKLLVYGSEYHEILGNAASYGWSVGATACNSSILLANVRQEVDRLNEIHIKALANAGVELIKGWGTFVDPHTVQVGEKQFTAENIMVAVGGRPQRLSIPGGDLGWVSDDLFVQEALPSSILIIGAGYIACEFACILQGLGVEVTQVIRGESILKGFDAELSDAVREGMQELGVNLLFGLQPTAIRQSAKGMLLLCNETELEADVVLQAAGRKAYLEPLALDKAGISHDGHRIGVDGHQRTNVPHIFAVGDVTDRINLTPVAIDEGRAVADAIFAGGTRVVNHNLVATAVFTQPELASVGLSEETAKDRFGVDDITVHMARFRDMHQALPKRGPRCLLKLVVELETDRVLGCHMVGSHSAEIIQMAAIAVGMGATKADFDRTMAVHPSISEEFVTMG